VKFERPGCLSTRAFSFLAEPRRISNAYPLILPALDVYGKIPNSPETKMLKLHDDTVAESVKLLTALKEYADKQEKNANAAMLYARDASPKGAARVTVETNAAILHTLNQLLRVNGQMLKTLSESLAFANKGGKDSVLHYNQVNRDMGKSLKDFNADFKTPIFD